MTLLNINKIIFYSFLLYIRFTKSNNNIYKIPFSLYRNKKLENSFDLLHNILYNSIYVNLSIGTPPQIIPFELNVNSQTFSAPIMLFDKNQSSSYEYFPKREISFENEDAAYGFNSKDILNINDDKKQKINFILGTQFKNKNYNNLGIIGLLIPKRFEYNIYTFFQSLRSAGFINSFTWTLKYFDNISLIDTIIYNEEKNNKNIGEFIFGDEPHNYEANTAKYDKNNYYKISPLSFDNSLYWDIEFNSVYLLFEKDENGKKISSKISIQGNNKIAEINPNDLFIVGPNEFFDSIKTNYFKQYFEQNICNQKYINNKQYYYIECNKSDTFKINTFPHICFEYIGFETKFNLSYKDLFIEDKPNKKYIFLIFNQKYFAGWILGTLFLRKYQFVFNEDYKTIGYYKSSYYFNDNYNEINDKKMNKIKISKYIIIIILLFIFSFILILFGMIIQRKYFNKNRRIRANELEDNFTYESYYNKKNNIINEENIIKSNEIEKNDKKYYSI